MFKFLKSFNQKYQTLNLIEVSKQNLLDNYKYLSKLDNNLKVAPVLKSNAYGHGIQLTGKILDQYHTPGVEHKIPFFCVDSLYEAYELLKAHIKTPILIMGYTVPNNFKIKKLPFKYVIYDLETARVLNKYQPGAKVHLFINTGMNREGISLTELDDFLIAMKQLHNLIIEGLMSHLASSQSDKDKLFLNQVKNFKKAQEILKKHKIKPKWVHLSASGAITNPKTRPIIAKVSNLTRAGISLYGFDPNPTSVIPAHEPESMQEAHGSRVLARDDTKGMTITKNNNKLKPVLTLKTKLSQIKTIKKGERVGYDGTFVAKKDMLIGILPIGYYDGVDRRLSNKGVFLINGVECPILGKVSMNINIIDLSKVKNPKVGDEVVVYSNNPEDKNSLQMSAKLCNTIAYDLLVNLAESTKRVVI